MEGLKFYLKLLICRFVGVFRKRALKSREWSKLLLVGVTVGRMYCECKTNKRYENDPFWILRIIYLEVLVGIAQRPTTLFSRRLRTLF